MTLAKVIKERRLELGLSYKEIAYLLNKSSMFVYQIEKYNSCIGNLLYLKQLAQILNLDERTLLTLNLENSKVYKNYKKSIDKLTEQVNIE